MRFFFRPLLLVLALTLGLGPSQAQFPFPNVLPRSAAATVVKTASAVNTANQLTYTFSAQSLGVASSTRKIVVLSASNQNGNLGTSGITVAGVAATELLDVGTSVGNVANVAMYQIANSSLPLGTETSADIVVTFAGTQGSDEIVVYAVYGAASAVYASGSQIKGSGAANTKTLDIPANGVAIGFAALTQSGSDPTSATWTNLTEDVDLTVGAGERLLETSASVASATLQTALSITMTPTNAEDSGLLLASWAPL